MPLLPLSAETQKRLIGSPIDVLVEALDAENALTDLAVLTAVVTLPDGTTAPLSLDRRGTGTFYGQHLVTVVGRHTVLVTSDGYGSAAFVAHGMLTTPNDGLPDVADVDDYLRSGGGDHSWSPDDMDDALRAETAAQARVCRIPPTYPDDLRQALLRRVQRNLAMRANTLGYVQGDADVTVLPQNDPEVRRFERPHRKVIIG